MHSSSKKNENARPAETDAYEDAHCYGHMEQPFKCNKTFKWKIGLTTHSGIHQSQPEVRRAGLPLERLDHRLSCRETPSNAAADELAGIVSFFLESVPEFQQDQTGLDRSARSTLDFGAKGLKVSRSQGLKV